MVLKRCTGVQAWFVRYPKSVMNLKNWADVRVWSVSRPSSWWTISLIGRSNLLPIKVPGRPRPLRAHDHLWRFHVQRRVSQQPNCPALALIMHLDANSRGLGGDQGTFLLYSKVNGSSLANERTTDWACCHRWRGGVDCAQTVTLIMPFHYSYDGA